MEITPEMIAQFIAVWTAWGAAVDQLNAWMMGTVAGGPEGDGRYPLTNRGGTTVLLPCPAKLAALLSPMPCEMSFRLFSRNTVVRGLGEEGIVESFRAPFGMMVDSVRLNVTAIDRSPPPAGGILAQALVGGTLTEAGIPMLSTRARLDAGQETSLAAGTTQAVIANPLIPDDARIDIILPSYGVLAKGLTITFKGHRLSP